MKVKIRPDPRAAAFAIIQVHLAVELRVEKPMIARQQKWPETGPIAGDEIEIIWTSRKVTRVIREVHYRHRPEIQHSVLSFESLVGNNLEILCSNSNRGLGDVRSEEHTS